MCVYSSNRTYKFRVYLNALPTLATLVRDIIFLEDNFLVILHSSPSSCLTDSKIWKLRTEIFIRHKIMKYHWTTFNYMHIT